MTEGLTSITVKTFPATVTIDKLNLLEKIQLNDRLSDAEKF